MSNIVLTLLGPADGQVGDIMNRLIGEGAVLRVQDVQDGDILIDVDLTQPAEPEPDYVGPVRLASITLAGYADDAVADALDADVREAVQGVLDRWNGGDLPAPDDGIDPPDGAEAPEPVPVPVPADEPEPGPDAPAPATLYVDVANDRVQHYEDSDLPFGVPYLDDDGDPCIRVRDEDNDVEVDDAWAALCEFIAVTPSVADRLPADAAPLPAIPTPEPDPEPEPEVKTPASAPVDVPVTRRTSGPRPAPAARAGAHGVPQLNIPTGPEPKTCADAIIELLEANRGREIHQNEIARNVRGTFKASTVVMNVSKIYVQGLVKRTRPATYTAK